MANNDGTIVMEDARIIFRNFAGKEGQYNREGDRNFCVLLDDDLAKQLDTDGWNVKTLRSREEGEPDQPYLQVTAKYRNRMGGKTRPPRIVMISSKGRTDISEDEVEILDWVDIRTVDLIIRPFEWEVGDKSGLSAYLKSMFITIEEDELDLKYADLEDAPARNGRIEEN